MRKVIIAYGMKRSGNHAVLNWISAHGRFLFSNNLIPIGPILRGKKEIPSPKDFDRWQAKKRRLKVYGVNVPFGEIFFRNHSLMISLEDHDLKINPFFNLPSETIRVLVVRNPSNVFSSRIRKAFLIEHTAYPRQKGPELDRSIDVWKAHAREFLGMTSHLENKVCIYFDAWFSNLNYRKKISQQLGLNFTDQRFSTVANTGGGSSFDGTRLDGESHRMDVLNRKDHLSEIEQELLNVVLDDAEIRDLAEKLGSIMRRRTGLISAI